MSRTYHSGAPGAVLTASGARLVPRPRRKPWTAEDLRAALDLQEAGYRICEIARKLGRSDANVSARLRRAGGGGRCGS